MITKEYEASEECHLRRRASVVGMKGEDKQKIKDVLPDCVMVAVCKEND